MFRVQGRKAQAAELLGFGEFQDQTCPESVRPF